MSDSNIELSTGKFIVGRILAVWAIFIFASTMMVAVLFLLPCFVLSEPAIARLHRRITQIWMRFFLFFIGCRIKIKGAHHFVKGENYVIVCNHNSLMDVPVSTPFMPRANKTIAKVSFSKVPIFGWVYKFGSVLVDRRSDQSRRKSYEEMKTILSLGLDMLIYPEGTRNRTGDPLKSFFDGAFRLAVDTNKRILPTVLFNSKNILPPSPSFCLFPGKIEMHFLPPVNVEGKTSKELKEEVFELIWNYYADHQSLLEGRI
ncbi:MAG: lysophospholipid acyltransferase family protein [Sediminibacterium sp.]